MDKKTLWDFLYEPTDFSALGDVKAVIQHPAFKDEIGKSLQSGNELSFSMELGERLDRMDIYKACVVTNFIGFACERTENTEAGKNVVLLLQKVLNLAKEFFSLNTDAQGNINIPDDMSVMYEKHRECTEAFYGCDILCISAMAFLSRDFEYRKLLRSMRIKETLEYLTEEVPENEYTRSVYYVNQVHDTCGKIPLLVLDPENRQGFLAEANDLNNCFHLIFLLEEAIYTNLCQKYRMENHKINQIMSKFAHGEHPECGHESQTTFFLECNYHEFNSSTNLLWGEMPPECIPVFNGYHVVVLCRNKMLRSYDAGFLAVGHSALNPYLEIERELSSDEYDHWESLIKSCLDTNKN